MIFGPDLAVLHQDVTEIPKKPALNTPEERYARLASRFTQYFWYITLTELVFLILKFRVALLHEKFTSRLLSSFFILV